MALRVHKAAASVLLGLFAACSAPAQRPDDVLGRFKSPSPCITGLAWDGKHIWAADRRLRAIFCLQPSNGKTLWRFPAPDLWPVGLAWDGEALWCADRSSRMLYRMDTRSGRVLKKRRVRAKTPFGLAWDGKSLWLADEGTRSILKINPANGALLEKFRAPAYKVQGLAFDGTYLWASDRLADEIYALTLRGDVLFVAKAPGPYATGLAFDGRHLLCADYQVDCVFTLRSTSDTSAHRSEPHPAMLTVTHEAINSGPGRIAQLHVYLAVPENRDNQKLLSPIRFEPQPMDFVTDGWGQRFAHFVYRSVPPRSSVTSRMTVKAVLYKVDYFLRPDKVGTLKDIPPEIRRRYTRGGKKYRTDDPVIEKAVSEAVGAEKNPYWIAWKIYRYLHSKIRYELAGGWDDAPVVLKRGTGSCSEYSFAFIAMARKAGLPARYVGSVVIRGDDASFDDVFHRWVEVYLPPYGWVPVDPSSGDSASPRIRALRFGHLENRYLITTQSGGPSAFLGWAYNASSRYHLEEKTRVRTDLIGEWEPLGEAGN